jgi:predicted transcriptional regulator
VTFLSCQLCQRESCPSRIAPYDDKLRKMYGLEND